MFYKWQKNIYKKNTIQKLCVGLLQGTGFIGLRKTL